MDSEESTASSPIYIAVIGDLVGSRELSERGAIQERLNETIVELNHSFSQRIASDLLITLGDEIQGLLETSASVSDIWWSYQRHMHSLAETRFSFGVGTLSTALRKEALGMDGPCFYAAREALTFGHKEHLNIAFGLHGRANLTKSLNRLGKLADKIIKQWSPAQWKTVLEFRKYGSQTEAAKALGVTKQTVYDSLKSSLGVECLEYWNGIDDLLHALFLE